MSGSMLRLAALKVLSGQITLAASTVTNAMIVASAGIPYSKLTLTDSIADADVNSAAAIAGTKVSPNFGSQDITTTGDVGLGEGAGKDGFFRPGNDGGVYKAPDGAAGATISLADAITGSYLVKGGVIVAP